MANDAERMDDVSAMMEALWGPPREGSFHEPAPPPAPPEAVDPPHLSDDRPHLSDDRPHLSDDRPAPLVDTSDLRAEFLAAVAAVETRLTERLEVLEKAVSSAGVDSQVRETVVGLAGLVDAQVAELRGAMAALRSDLDAAIASQHDDDTVDRRMAALEQGVAGHLDAALAEVAQQREVVLEEAAARADARLRDVGGGLQRQLNSLAEQVVHLSPAAPGTAAGTDDFDALQAELRETVSRQMASAQQELQRRVELLDTAIADARVQLAERLDELAKLVATEAARATQRALTQASVDSPARADVLALRQRVDDITASLAALRARPS